MKKEMKHRTTAGRKLRTFITMFLVTVLILAGGISYGVYRAKAAAGDTPPHSKTATNNEDGTYKLELSVTGDADNETQESGNVDVVVVYDVSQSMSTQDVRVGNRSYSRADQAEDVVHDFLTNLAGYQNNAKNNIRVSLVNFGVNATQVQGWTTDVTGLANRFDDNGTDGRVSFTYNSYGTNWDHALNRANTLVGSAREGVPTFVILITDGAPTATGSQGSDAIAPTGATIRQLRERYDAATDDAYNIANAISPDGTFYGIYAYGTEADLLDDLMYFSVNNQHRGGSINNVVAETQTAPNYYNAGNTAALQTAIDEIFDKVVQAMGISSAAISDGTTKEVVTSTGEIAELLEVDESSYQYWLSIPVVNNSFTRVTRDGTEVTYTVAQNGDTCTVTWGSNSVTVNGKIEGGQLKYEWTEANALYDYDPPEAKLNGSSVDWNLSSVGTLLDGVTYSVTFDVYPSQRTLDTVADIMNDPGEDGAWGGLDSEIQKYIGVDGRLKTNTTATLSYVDTRNNQPGSTTYTNPDPIATTAVEQLAVAKKWENELDNANQPPVTLTVTRDGKDTYDVTLSSDNGWSDSVFISIGIMRTNDKGEMEVLDGAEGHDFTFTEPENLSYHWELDVPTVHPMMIDGTTTMLVKADAKHPVPDGAQTYEINGAEYYADEEITKLTATNYRRSSLDLTKVVTGAGAPEAAEFPFTLNVVNSNATNGSEGNLNSDYYVWFSVWDKDDQPVNDAVVSGATAEDGQNGWYYAKSGSNVVLNIKAGYNVRVGNLPTGSTYTFTEGTLPSGFEFVKAELSFAGTGKADATFSGGLTSTGTIQDNNTVYTVTYTNEYKLRDATVVKTFTGITEDQIPDGFKVTASYDDTTKEFTVVDDDVEVSSDGLTYTWKITGLAIGTEVSVTESGADIANYDLEATLPEEPLTVAEDGENTIEIENAYTLAIGNLKITKALGNGSEQVTIPADTTFTISGPIEKTVKYSAFQNGSYTFEDLPIGEYTVTESGADVTGYTLTKTVSPEKADVASGATAEVTVTNTYTKKTDTDRIDNYITVEKVDGDGTTLEGATFSLTGDDVNKTFQAGTAVITTGALEQGQTGVALNLPDLNAGETTTLTLTMEETEAPSGYQKDDATYTITIQGKGEEALTNGVFVTTTTYTISTTLQGKVVNTKITGTDRTDGTVTIKKVDQDGKALDGATFSLTGGNINLTFTAGTAVISTGTLNDGAAGVSLKDYLPDLKDGETKTLTLTLKETAAPGGYTPDTDEYEVAITGVGEETLTDGVFVTTTTYTIKVDGESELEVTNTKKTDTDREDGTVTIKKVDQDGKALDGATFSLTGTGVSETITIGEATIGTGAEGTVKLNLPDLEAGKTSSLELTLKEETAPAGYTEDNTEYKVVITGEAKEALVNDTWVTTTTYTIKVDGKAELEVTNTKNTDTDREDGTITIKKVDQDGKALDGAVFSLTGSGINETITIGEAEIGTGSDGTLALSLPDLAAGETKKYELTLKETKAPEGYELDNTAHSVVIIGEAKENLADNTWITLTTYTITVDGSDELVITNKVKQDPPPIPRTGDSFIRRNLPWMIIMLAAAIGATGVVVYRIKSRKNG